MPIDSKHKDYTAWSSKWQRCRDVVSGQDAVKDAGTTYLKKMPGQTEAEYEVYKEPAYFFEATGRTVNGMKGLLFRKPTIIAGPPRLSDNLATDDVSVEEFAEEIVADVLTVNRCGVLIDYPDTGEESYTQQQAEALGLKPYWTIYKAESIWNWAEMRIGGRKTLSLVVLAEDYDETNDGYTATVKTQLRELSLVSVPLDNGNTELRYRQRVFRKVKVAGEIDEVWLQVGSDVFPQMYGGRYLAYIPFRFFDDLNGTPAVKKPTILGLVNMNLSHYYTIAELEHARLFVGNPTPVFYGSFISKDGSEVTNIRIGSSSGINMTEASRSEFLELKGGSLMVLENAEKEKREMMAVLGSRILASEKRAVEAAETAAIHRASENSVIASIAHIVSAGLKWCLEVRRDWTGETGDITVELNTDFQAESLSADDVVKLVDTWQRRGFAYTDLVRLLQRGEIVAPDRTAEDMKADLDAEGPALGTL